VQLTNLNLNEGFSTKKIPQEHNVANTTLPLSLINKIMEVVVVGIMFLLRKKNYYGYRFLFPIEIV
jgi:hypothetical protein